MELEHFFAASSYTWPFTCLSFLKAKVLEPLGAITSVSQFLEPDGLFPNHIPNPEDKEAMKAITQAIRCCGFHREGVQSKPSNCTTVCNCTQRSITIVTDSVTSDGLATFIEQKLGGKHYRFKRGYKNVIDEAITLVNLLNKLASARASGVGGGSKVLNDLVDGLEEPGFAGEVRINIKQNHPDLKGGFFRECSGFRPQASQSSSQLPRVRASGFGGWLLLRLSLHDPILPLNLEALRREDAVKLGLLILAAIAEFPALDTYVLYKFVRGW
ncbi:hypothetical protein MLD38_003734 [Melastoma candidum]|uniref:Uncharacterized protein n=1 Tax=Melastoma candidum TaxID=119954 RepID=A0ACB9S3N1_9MYRT|nr:hypothetical protein MLD38_003734 [Melastoma candidum]